MPAALRRSLVALLFLTAPLVLAAATFGLPSAADDAAEAAATSDAAASSDATPTSAPAGTALDLTGKWLLRHTVLRSDLIAIKNHFDRMDSGKKMILTTEKDATRLDMHRSFILENKLPVYLLPVDIDFHFQEKSVFEEDIKNYLLNFKV